MASAWPEPPSARPAATSAGARDGVDAFASGGTETQVTITFRRKASVLPAPGFFVITFLMDLNVELDGDEIVVTKPKSAFLLAYRKSIEEPRLVLTRSQMPQMSVSSASEFRAQAFQAAEKKARELGWIM